ncbi:MAG: O-antigen/teichoic acid export membrane protein [Planctomycetaceae bacterium]|jgi:O-antigen/teichoic acid export membrane protein
MTDSSAEPPSEKPPRRLSPLSLKVNFAWTFLGNALVAVCQLGLMALLWDQAGDATTGQYIIALAISAPVFMFAGLDLRTLQATDSSGEVRFIEYLSLRLICGCIALAIVPMIAVAWGHRADTLAVITGVGVGRFFLLIGDTFNGLMQQSERMDRVAHSIVLKGVLSTLVLGTTFVATGSLVMAVFAEAAARFLVLAFYDFPLGRQLAYEHGTETISLVSLKTVEPARLTKLTLRSLPLAFKVMLVSLDTHVTRYIVSFPSMGGLSDLGVFGPIASGAGSASMVGKALNQSVSAKLGRLATAGEPRPFVSFVRRLQLLYLVLGAAGVGFTVVAGGPLLALVRPDALAFQTLLTLVVISVALDLQNGIVDMSLVAARRIAPLAPACGLSVATSAVGCWLLIPSFGLNGAAMAMIAGRLMRMAALNAALAVETRRSATDETSFESSTTRRKAA